MAGFMTQLCWLTASILGLAGVIKLVDLGEFERQLASWSLLSHDTLRFGVVIGLPIVEIGMCAAFACFPSRRVVIAAGMLVLLFTFSVAYSIEAIAGTSPDCGCFGMLFRQMEFRTETGWVLGKNLLLAVPPALLIWSRRCHAPTASHGRASGARGFSLVETLVVISVVAIMTAIVLPALSHARRSGRVSTTLSTVRQHSGVFLMYSQDFSEQFPYFTRPEPGPSTTLIDPSGLERVVDYFGARYAWPTALTARYYNGAESRSGVFVSPFRTELQRPSWDYLYPCVFLADPTYWRPETRMFPPMQFRSTRQSDISFPSAKVLISDECYWETTQNTPSPFAAAGCVDGHAERVSAQRIPRPYVLGEGTGNPNTSPYGYHAGSNDVFMHTIGGVSERDFFGQ